MGHPEEDRFDREARRCLADAGAFRCVATPGGVLRRRAELSDAQVLEAVELHRERARHAGDSAILKADHRAVVTAVETPAGAWCVKEFRRPGLRRRLEDGLRGSRARHAWLGAHACAVRGIPAPRALAILEGRGCSFFVSELVADALTIQQWVGWHRPARDAAERRRWWRLVEQVADFVARLHGHRLRHRDLSAKNILARETAEGFELFLLDLSDIRLGRWPSRRFKVRNLGQLAQIPLAASRTDAQRFFRRYAAVHPELDRPENRAAVAAIARARQARWLEHGGREWLREHQASRPG